MATNRYHFRDMKTGDVIKMPAWGRIPLLAAARTYRRDNPEWFYSVKRHPNGSVTLRRIADPNAAEDAP